VAVTAKLGADLPIFGKNRKIVYYLTKLNLSDIYQKAWDTTRKHKSLWVFGLVLAAFSGGSSYSNISRSFNSESIEKLMLKDSDNLLDSAVLGAQSVKGVADTSFNLIKNIAMQIPISTWIIAGIATGLAVVLGITFGLVIKNWAKGALIAGIDNTETQSRVYFTKSSFVGTARLKKLITLGLTPLPIFIVTALLNGIAFTILFAFFPQEKLPWSIAIPFTLVLLTIDIVAIAVLAKLILAYAWAERLIVLENYKPIPALRKGYKIARANLKSMLKLALGNCLVSTGVGCITNLIVAIPIGLAVGGFALHKTLGIVASIPAALAVLAFTVGGILITGILTVFKYTTWNILFKQIREKDGKTN